MGGGRLVRNWRILVLMKYEKWNRRVQERMWELLEEEGERGEMIFKLNGGDIGLPISRYLAGLLGRVKLSGAKKLVQTGGGVES